MNYIEQISAMEAVEAALDKEELVISVIVFMCLRGLRPMKDPSVITAGA